MTQLTDFDIKLINGFEDAMLRGFYIQGRTVFDLYNKVFGTNIKPTNCATCIKHRINELINVRNEFLDALKQQEEQLPTEDKTSENIPTTEENVPLVAPKKRGRKPKSN